MIEVPLVKGGLPLLGHTIDLFRRPFSFLLDARALGDVVEIHLGSQPVFVLNDPSLIRQVLATDPGKFDPGSMFERGWGLHLQQQPHVRPACAESMARVAAAHVDQWLPGQLLAIDEEIHDITMATTAKALCSSELGTKAVAEFRRSLPDFSKWLTRRALTPFTWMVKVPTPCRRRFVEAGTRMRAVVLEMIRAYRDANVDVGDFLSVLLRPDPRTGECMPDENAYDEAITLMVTGTEISASTVSWALHHIGQDAGIEQRLQDEVDTVLAGRRVGFDDIPRLPYVRRILYETMRMHPLALLPRRARTDVVLGGHRYPEGTRFLISPHALHHDARYFAEPERFDPDRFLPERAAAIKRECYIPFGAGGCASMRDAYALADMAIILATIASKWRLVPSTEHTVKETLNGVTQVDALPMIADAR